MKLSHFSGWGSILRQLRYHRQFRIAQPEWGAAERTRLRQLTEHLSEIAQQGNTSRPDGQALDEAALAEAATNLWRARKKIAQSATTDSRTVRQVNRYLRTAHDALDNAGLVVQDHDDEEFHPGLSLEVLAFHEDPALGVETVRDTIRPSIYLLPARIPERPRKGKRIQMGQVIVGCPAKSKTSISEDGHA